MFMDIVLFVIPVLVAWGIFILLAVRGAMALGIIASAAWVIVARAWFFGTSWNEWWLYAAIFAVIAVLLIPRMINAALVVAMVVLVFAWLGPFQFNWDTVDEVSGPPITTSSGENAEDVVEEDSQDCGRFAVDRTSQGGGRFIEDGIWAKNAKKAGKLLLAEMRHNPEMLFVAWNGSPAVSNGEAKPLDQVSDLVEGECYSQKGRATYLKLAGALSTATWSNTEASASAVNTGTSGEGQVFASEGGISGDRSSVTATMPDGSTMEWMRRCGNLVDKKPPKNVPPKPEKPKKCDDKSPSEADGLCGPDDDDVTGPEQDDSPSDEGDTPGYDGDGEEVIDDQKPDTDNPEDQGPTDNGTDSGSHDPGDGVPPGGSDNPDDPDGGDGDISNPPEEEPNPGETAGPKDPCNGDPNCG